MTTPRFSIITCTRNSLATLPDTVRSVQEQDFTDYEHVFIDGNSTDGTLDYLRSLPGPVRIIEGVGGGISRAMNVGIEQARGEFIAHLHSDDYYADAQVLSRVSKALADSGARWLFGRCLFNIDGKVVPEGHEVWRYSYAKLLKRNFVPHPATFVAKSLFNECGGFDEKIRYAMDYELWLRLGRHAEPLQLDDHLAVFRKHAGSATTANQMASFEDDWQVRQRYLPPGSLDSLIHRARYWVRRRRLTRALAQQG